MHSQAFRCAFRAVAPMNGMHPQGLASDPGLASTDYERLPLPPIEYVLVQIALLGSCSNLSCNPKRVAPVMQRNILNNVQLKAFALIKPQPVCVGPRRSGITPADLAQTHAGRPGASRDEASTLWCHVKP